jgi:hypothetical protein
MSDLPNTKRVRDRGAWSGGRHDDVTSLLDQGVSSGAQAKVDKLFDSAGGLPGSIEVERTSAWIPHGAHHLGGG